MDEKVEELLTQSRHKLTESDKKEVIGSQKSESTKLGELIWYGERKRDSDFNLRFETKWSGKWQYD